MFLAWGTTVYRPTRDIDLLGFTTNELDAISRIFQEICDQEVEPDGLIFDNSFIQCERIKEDADYEGIRVYLAGYLGKAKIPLQIDIGFADVVSPAPITLKYPTILHMTMPQLRGYSPESMIAEKLQALIFLGQANSRMKDFHDLWVMAEHFKFDGGILQGAIISTFQRRKTELPLETPLSLSDSFAVEKQSQWQAFRQRMHLDTVPISFSYVSRIINGFLVPPLRKSAVGELFEGTWEPGGPWRFLI